MLKSGLILLIAMCLIVDSRSQVNNKLTVKPTTKPTTKPAIKTPQPNTEITGNGGLAVTISDRAKFTAAPKQEFQTITTNGCKITPIKYQISDDKIGTFFISSSKEDKIYPGAVYHFDDIKYESFIPYHLEYARSPMHLTTNILAFNNKQTIKKQNAVTENLEVINPNEFDAGTIRRKWNVLLGNSINGSTPGEIKKYLQIIESSEQLKTDFQTIGQVDVSTKIGVEIPQVPVGVSVDNSVSVRTSTQNSASYSNSKNTIVLKFEQVFYTANISPISGYPNIYTDRANESLEDDLVYISSIDYGMVYYLTITSSASKSDLYQAIQSSTSTSTGVSASFPIQGVPVNAEVDVNTSHSTMSTSTANKILNESIIKVFQWGGQSINDIASSTNLNDILNQLNNRTKFSSTNLGAPINYCLRFVKNNGEVWINYDSKYASVNCSKVKKYDVDIVLNEISRNGSGVTPFDMVNSNFYGKVHLTKWELKNTRDREPYKQNNEDIILWQTNKENAIKLPPPASIKKIHSQNIATIKSLSYEELSDLIFYLKADFTNKDTDKRLTNCQRCDEPDNSRRYSMRGQMDEVDAKNEIGDWSNPLILKIGDDRTTDIICSQGNIKYVQATFQIKIYAADE